MNTIQLTVPNTPRLSQAAFEPPSKQGPKILSELEVAKLFPSGFDVKTYRDAARRDTASKANDKIIRQVNSDLLGGRIVDTEAGVATAKPITLASGLTLPPGTQVSGIGGPLYSVSKPESFLLQLPNGGTLRFVASRDTRTGAAVMKLEMNSKDRQDTVSFNLRGQVFFDSTRGALIFVQAERNANGGFVVRDLREAIELESQPKFDDLARQIFKP
jgi:hypothetical protein